ncbi:MAG: peptidase domain-containing ABC transporter, partial [Okeania sp. SIO2H7]|nr:peptidase domain-containing ABC transporter [Okeania sp. SIO2H7]
MKYSVVLQHNVEDCGAACMASIAKYYGRIFTIARTREATGTGQLGTTLLNLKQGAKVLGFNARGVQVPLELVDKNSIPLPGIIHWKGNHWVVLYGRRGKKYVVADPAVGIRFLSPDELVSSWSNRAMLLLEPRPDFYQNPDDRDKVSGLSVIFGRIWNYRAIIAEALLLNLFLDLLSLASPFLIQILTDDVLIRGDRDLLAGIAIAVLVTNAIAIG